MSSGATLQTISIQAFRSYATLDAEFGPGPQLIVGPNAAGKTTLLEAIVLLAWGRSHRTSADAELVRWGSELARIEGVAGAETVEVALVRPVGGGGARKRIRVNGVARRLQADRRRPLRSRRHAAPDHVLRESSDRREAP